MKKLLLLAVVALSMSLVACGGKAKTPEDAVKKYTEAMAKMDAKAAADVINFKDAAAKDKFIKDSEKEAKEIKEVGAKVEILKIGEGNVVEKDKKVKFDVKMKTTMKIGEKEESNEVTETITTVKVGDEWKVEE